MNRYYSNVLYNGLESITLPLLRPEATVQYSNESVHKVSSEMRWANEVLDEFPQCSPHSIIRGDNK